MTIDIPEGYEALGLVLGEAVAQAARGKGAERHAESGEKFSDQLIMSIPKRLGPGGECFCLGQALKKICESRRLPPDRARAEILGAINYLAASWCLLGGTEGVPEERASRQIANNGVVSAPEAPKDTRNVCLEFSERVVSLMKEMGVREVSFAGPGACIRADGTVTGLHFTTDGADAPRTKEELFRRIREVNPAVYRQEDADMPRFQTGELVEFRPRDGKWRPAAFDRMDGNFAVVVSRNEKFRVPACDVRPAEKS